MITCSGNILLIIPSLWRNYFIKLIKLGVSNNSEIVTTSKYSKNGLKNIFNNKISYIYQSSERFIMMIKSINQKITFYILEHLKVEKIY